MCIFYRRYGSFENHSVGFVSTAGGVGMSPQLQCRCRFLSQYNSLCGCHVCVSPWRAFEQELAIRCRSLCKSTFYFFTHCRPKIFFGLAKGSGAAADILATIAMCIYLTSARTGMSELVYLFLSPMITLNVGNHRTNHLITKLTRFVIHRGALVTLIQTLLLITFYAAPNNLYW